MKKPFFASITILAAVAVGLAAGLSSASASVTVGQRAPDVAASPVPAPPRPLAAHPPVTGESVYVAITPCRIVDTRVAGGKFNNTAARTFAVAGTSGFAAQGGNPAGCGIPLSATAISATIAVTNAASAGYLTAWPAGQTRPHASNLNYDRGQTIATGGNVTIARKTAQSLQVFNFGGPTDVFIDVTGYYAQQMQGMIAPDGTIYSGTDRIVSARSTGIGIYQVTFDSDVSNCAPMVDTFNQMGVYGSAYALDGAVITVYTWNLNPTSHVETPASYYFYLSVLC